LLGGEVGLFPARAQRQLSADRRQGCRRLPLAGGAHALLGSLKPSRNLVLAGKKLPFT